MTGRELITYILENHLEDEPVFQNRTFVGYVSDVKFAEMFGVGVATVRAWIMMGHIKDAIMIGDTMFVSMIYVNELQKQKRSPGDLISIYISLKSEVKHESEIE